MKRKKIYLVAAIMCMAVIPGVTAYYLFAGITEQKHTEYLYIDDDDNLDSVSMKLEPLVTERGRTAIRTLARHLGYADNVRSGRYALEPGVCAITLFRNLRNGHQEPVRLTIPCVRTTERLAEELGKKLMITEDDIHLALQDHEVCRKYSLDSTTIISMFIPNTYEVYWNISIDKFLDKMKKESDKFWEGDRMEKAKNLGLSPLEVITLASIVEEETANDGEKPMIAGMYYNRLQQGMPLQADPTVKFALQDFGLRRIYRKQLSTDSPYNTYRNTGLPPGPIRIPSVVGIDAVLNMAKHDYLYMCAKEDFSGTHNFARTYSEHLINAARYSKALDARGVK